MLEILVLQVQETLLPDTQFGNWIKKKIQLASQRINEYVSYSVEPIWRPYLKQMITTTKTLEILLKPLRFQVT